MKPIETMNKLVYENLKEEVYYKKLSNGLTLNIIPKKNFKRFFVSFGTKYGSLTNIFKIGENEVNDIPLGAAHFLEHQVFTTKSGFDLGNLFQELKLEVNAFTNYCQTVYYFNGSENLEEGINLLLDSIQEPGFTEESVEKERGIIEQEVLMYMDAPNDRLHSGLMEVMFKNYPLRYDIGGTIESVNKITYENLKKCHSTFYHPSNMMLVVVGDVDPHYICKLVEDNQNKHSFEKIEKCQRIIPKETKKVYKKFAYSEMEIVMPKVTLGIKLPLTKAKRNEMMLQEEFFKILLESKFSSQTDLYQYLIDNELISGSVNSSVYLHDGKFGYISLSANSKKPDELQKILRENLLALQEADISNEEFVRYKKVILGNLLNQLNSLGFIGISFLEYEQVENSELLSLINLLEKSSLDDIKKMGKYFTEDALCEFVIYPKKDVN